ncbi:MAG: endonuclease NucS, partial [Desulfurococcaceae archaeon]
RKLVDKAEFVMYVDENVMRDTIAENPWIIEEGLEVLEVEKPVEDGYVDIYAMDKHKRRVLIELKRVTATREAVLQLYKYVEAYRREHGVTPRGILVAPSFSPTALETLHRLGLEYRYVDLRKIWELVKKKQVKRAKPLDEFLRKQG